MTEEIKKVLEIEFKGQQTIGDVKTEVANLKKELDACVAGSAEAEEKSQELAQAQEKLKAAMKGAVDETGKLNNSYNGIVSQMNKLKAAQKQVDVSTKAGKKQYQQYAQEINKLNDKLKSMDASNGVFARNVGNYANSLKEAFSGMGGAIGGVFTGISNGLKMLVTNPWVALLTAILVAVQQLIEAFKRNSDAMLKVNLAFNKFKAVLVIVQRAFDTLVQKITDGSGAIKKVVGKITDWLSGALNGMVEGLIRAIGWVKGLFGEDNTEEMLNSWRKFKDGIAEENKEIVDTLNKITKMEDELARQHVKNTQTIAENNKKIAELNAIVTDRENKSIDERTKALEESAKLQKQNIQLQINEAKKELEILKLRNSLNKTNTAGLQEEADLEAKVIGLQAQQADIERNIATQRQALIKDAVKEGKEALETQKKSIEQQLTVTKKGSDEHLRLTKQKLAVEKELAIIDARDKIKDETKLQEALALIDQTYKDKEIQAEKDHQRDLVDIRIQQMQNDADILSKGSQEYYDAVVKLKKYVLENLTQLENETDEAFQARVIKATNEYNKAVEDARKKAGDTANKKASNNANQSKLDNGSASLQYYQAELEAARTYYDNLQQLQDESNEDFEARQIAALQKVKNAEKNLNNQRLDNYMAVADGITSIMSTVASAWEDSIRQQVESGKISEEEGEKQFENVKAMQIAIAVVNTISGAIAAFMKSQELGQPWGLIIGAVQAAAVTAAGVAEIAKIKSTTLGGGGSSVSAGGGAGGGVTLPRLEDYQPEYTQNLTNGSDMQDLSGTITSALEQASIKAYVVESDVTDAQNKAKRRNQESTW